MKYLSFIVFVLIALCSCNKETKILNKLEGNWKVDLIRIEDGEGFTFYDSLPTGTFQFGKIPKTCNANCSYNYVNFGGFQINDSLTIVNGSFEFSSVKNRILITSNSDTIDARIIMLTKKAIELEYYDLIKFRLVRFVMSKD
ncbi:MAG: hypothetical protein EBQ94_04505 [Flavobacteriales bacterium]|jgi:hypothetical protein|nr:hypothetical protein [Crocinitomicaceae bacterium]NBX79632.1 hypothetical protein [Flavobacteriales bacterium]NCA21786.1 hypothetical protein [Crocinitomicaceae bacterium]